MEGKESDRTLMTVESGTGGTEDSVAEASSISLPQCLDFPIGWLWFVEINFVSFFFVPHVGL